MAQRKYFKYRIVELEDVFGKAENDCALLEELEEELEHRSTQRAKKLLENVRRSLNNVTSAPRNDQRSVSSPPVEQAAPKPEPVIDNEENIDWASVLSNAPDTAVSTNEDTPSKTLSNIPEDIIDAWTVLEALSPQTYKKPDDLVIGTGSVAYLKKGLEPWLKGEKSRPKNQLYYLVYLGAVKLEEATEELLKLYQDKRAERPNVKGLAALGVVLLDKKGIPVPDTGLALSSFGWAYARALQGKLQELKHWEVAEKTLIGGLENIIYRQDEDGRALPFSLEQAQAASQWIIKNCGIPEQDTIPPTFATRLYQPFSKGSAETPLLNSFFLDDLQRAKSLLGTKDIGKALSQYLGITKPEHEYDILNDKGHLEKALEPKNTPTGRWPGNGRHPLVLLQQNAVNLAMNDLKDGGLFSVNGPPGTGKTTLLRDIVAGVMVERAKALSKFKNTDDAFKHSGQMKLGGGFVHLYKLDESLRGHEIVVASTNNKAVENVSKELPLTAQVAQDLDDLNYFKTISNALSEGQDETWGLIAAVLGNSKNRSAFINKTWWDQDSGLRNYFLSITGQIDLEPDENGEVHIPKVIEECDPPEDLQEAKHLWAQARKRFDEALKKADNMIARAQRAYECYKHAMLIQKDIDQNLARQTEEQEKLETLQQQSQALQSQTEEFEGKLKAASEDEERSKQKKPGFFRRLFAWDEWKLWKAEYALILSALKTAQEESAAHEARVKENNDDIENVQKSLSRLMSKKGVLQKNFDTAMAEVHKEEAICGGKLVTPSLWKRSHEEQQTFAPNFTDEAQRLRDDVFVAAIELHKAFIDASAKQMRQNLGAFFYCLSGGGLPADKHALLPHLWSSAFLLTPVMSTAFASVGRMLKNLPPESLGWLLIDEAGQATPQAAIGAILRAKRVMSVGDPLQIEPVVTLPLSLVEGISKYMGVDPDHWMAPDASVQTLSDAANTYGTTIPRDLSEIRIGSPLLVHRRCENPMFSISNKLAYAGLMVHATQAKPSDINDVFGAQACWFNVEGSAQEKWSPEEGEHVSNMLRGACESLEGEPDIFVISPFRIVAERMKQRLRQDKAYFADNGVNDPDAWINNNIGTVHTFQGKEAKAVILLLGAPNPAQNGARAWATSNVNLLNVAVSRAKQNFYVVGNRGLWEEMGHMKLISKHLK